MSEGKKTETANIGSYLVAKNGTTKYIKLEAAPNAPEEVKDLVKKLTEALGTDVLYVNIYDQDFRSKYNVPDFVKGRISAPINPMSSRSAPAPSKGKKPSNNGVNF